MDNDWRRFVAVFALSAGGALLCAAAAIAVIDPLAISPLRLVSDTIVPQTNRRYTVPSIVRSGRYDSYIVGTSTAHTLDPQDMARVLPGKFANVSLLGSSPHEQAQLVALIAHAAPGPGTIVWGLDHNWCGADDAALRAGPEILPEWLYDESRLNDVPHAFNWSTLDMARRKLIQALTSPGERLQANGYSNMLPPDASYDIAKARQQIYGAAALRQFIQVEPPRINLASQTAQTAGSVVLYEVLGRLSKPVRVILVLMPAHAFAQPTSGSEGEKLLQKCKVAIAGAAAQRGAWLLDAMWHSTWTIEDASYWDSVHYRDHLARALIGEIGTAIGSAVSTPALRILVHGR